MCLCGYGLRVFAGMDLQHPGLMSNEELWSCGVFILIILYIVEQQRRHQKYKMTTWNYEVNKKSVLKIAHICSYLLTVYREDSFAHYQHYLNQLCLVKSLLVEFSAFLM